MTAELTVGRIVDLGPNKPDTLGSAITDIALSPIRRIGEQRLPENRDFRRAILSLRFVERRHIEAGREADAREIRSIIDGLVAAWRQR